MNVTRSRRLFIYAEYFEAVITRPFELVFAFVLLDYLRIQFLRRSFRNNRSKKSRSFDEPLGPCKFSYIGDRSPDPLWEERSRDYRECASNRESPLYLYRNECIDGICVNRKTCNPYGGGRRLADTFS